MGTGVVVAIAATLIVFATVIHILRPHGRRVQASSCTFIASLVATQLMMKQLSSPPLGYRFPASVTALHFLSVWMFCAVHWAWQGDFSKCTMASIGSRQRYIATILPIALSLPLSVVLNNNAMIYVGASVNAVIGTLAPVSTALLQQLFGRSLAGLSWVGIAFACIGALVITRAETQNMFGDSLDVDNTYGVLLSFTAVLCRSLKVVMQDRLLKPKAYGNGIEQSEVKPLEPLHLWALQAPPCALIAIIQALLSENLLDAWKQLTPAVALVILCTCVSATCLNTLGMITIRDLGASSMSIVGKLNIIITVALSVVFLGEALPWDVLVGTGIVLFGVGTFEYGETRMRHRDTALVGDTPAVLRKTDQV